MTNNSSSLKNRKFHLGYAQFLCIQLLTLCKNWMACCVSGARNTMKSVKSSLTIINDGRELRKKRTNCWGNPVHNRCAQSLSSRIEVVASNVRDHVQLLAKRKDQLKQKFGGEIAP
jgi:hypothetical protein